MRINHGETNPRPGTGRVDRCRGGPGGGLRRWATAWLGGAILLLLVAVSAWLAASGTDRPDSRPPEPPPTPALSIPPPPPPAEAIETVAAGSTEIPGLPSQVLGVTGWVLFEGTPVHGARVHGRSATGESLTDRFGLRTEEDGAFSFPVGHSDFPVTLRAMKSGFEGATMVISEPAEGVVLLLTKGLSISGVLLDEDRNPVGSSVLALRLDDSGRIVGRKGTEPGLWARCDDAGRFEITGVPPGRYRVAHSGVNHLKVEGSSVVCSAGDSGLELIVQRACGLEIHLVDAASGEAPEGKVTIHLTDELADSRKVETTIPKAVIRGLRAGTYSLRVSAPSYETHEVLGLRLSRLGDIEVLEVPLDRRGEQRLGDVEVRLEWPDEFPDAQGRPELLVRIVRDEPETEGSDWPPRRFPPGDRLTLSGISAGAYRLYAFSLDGRWVSPPVEICVNGGVTESAMLTLERGGEIVPKMDLSGPAAEGSDLSLLLFDDRGILLSVAWLDRIPVRLASLGPLPRGRITARLFAGDIPVASGTAFVESGKRTELRLR